MEEVSLFPTDDKFTSILLFGSFILASAIFSLEKKTPAITNVSEFFPRTRLRDSHVDRGVNAKSTALSTQQFEQWTFTDFFKEI